MEMTRHSKGMMRGVVGRQREEVLAEFFAPSEEIPVALAMEGRAEGLDDLARPGLVAVVAKATAKAGAFDRTVAGQVTAAFHIGPVDAAAEAIARRGFQTRGEAGPPARIAGVVRRQQPAAERVLR